MRLIKLDTISDRICSSTWCRRPCLRRPSALAHLTSSTVMASCTTHIPRAAFTQIAQLPKQANGMLYVWVYSHDQEHATPLRRVLMGIESGVRPVLSRLPGFWQTLVLAPILPCYVLYQNVYRRPQLGAHVATRYGWNEALHTARDRLTPPFAH